MLICQVPIVPNKANLLLCSVPCNIALISLIILMIFDDRFVIEVFLQSIVITNNGSTQKQLLYLSMQMQDSLAKWLLQSILQSERTFYLKIITLFIRCCNTLSHFRNVLVFLSLRWLLLEGFLFSQWVRVRLGQVFYSQLYIFVAIFANFGFVHVPTLGLAVHGNNIRYQRKWVVQLPVASVGVNNRFNFSVSWR